MANTTALDKLSTLKNKSKYNRYTMNLYCTEDETIYDVLKGLFMTKVLFQKKYNVMWVVNIDKIIPVFVRKIKHGYRMIPISYPLLKDMFPVKDTDYMAYTIGKHKVWCDFTLTYDDEYPVYEENDNLNGALLFTSYEDAITYRSLYVEYINRKKTVAEERHAKCTFTIAEIAKKLGVSETDLKIIDSEDNDSMYFDGSRPEDFGEFN